jgi:hypothetical protein
MSKRTLSVQVLLSIGLCTPAFAQWKTPAQIEENANRAAKLAVDTYTENGMSGLIGKSQECFKLLAKRGLECVAIDLASRHIDNLAVSQMKFPATDYFTNGPFGARVGPAFRQAGMDMQMANQLLQVLTPMVNQAVERYLSAGARR